MRALTTVITSGVVLLAASGCVSSSPDAIGCTITDPAVQIARVAGDGELCVGDVRYLVDSEEADRDHDYITLTVSWSGLTVGDNISITSDVAVADNVFMFEDMLSADNNRTCVAEFAPSDTPDIYPLTINDSNGRCTILHKVVAGSRTPSYTLTSGTDVAGARLDVTVDPDSGSTRPLRETLGY
jgi:hypothetical protein